MFFFKVNIIITFIQISAFTIQESSIFNGNQEILLYYRTLFRWYFWQYILW